ncbi:MAG TPA: hypothetical protein VL481_00930 [Verrucomicrobiae bacterium]|nr:hypothetical protein [Verrucomicrobiae bacterium]
MARGLFDKFDLHYMVGGDGTPAEPAYISFTFTGRPPRTAWLRGLFPATTVLEEKEDSAGFVLKGRNPSMSRADLSHAFLDVLRRQSWTGKGEDE